MSSVGSVTAPGSAGIPANRDPQAARARCYKWSIVSQIIKNAKRFIYLWQHWDSIEPGVGAGWTWIWPLSHRNPTPTASFTRAMRFYAVYCARGEGVPISFVTLHIHSCFSQCAELDKDHLQVVFHCWLTLGKPCIHMYNSGIPGYLDWCYLQDDDCS